MSLREAAQKALEVIHNQGDVSVDEWIAAEAALRTALAEADEPVAWQCRTRPTWGRRHGLEERPWSPWEFCSKEVAEDCWRTPFLNDWAYEARALYTHPPRREPLAEEELFDIYRADDDGWWQVTTGDFNRIARAIERAHGIGGES